MGHIKSVDGFVFFRLYFGYSDLQLFAIFIFEVVFSDTYLVTSAENNVLDPHKRPTYGPEVKYVLQFLD